MGEIEAVAVYCGSSRGIDPRYAESAAALGQLLADEHIRLVYGGGHVGLMGVVADAALERGGEVHGVITQALADREVAHASLSTLEVVDTMHQRKAAMADAADAFISLPGGVGTLDELFEVITWSHLGIHAKPLGLLDVGGFFDPLRALLEHAAREGFVPGALVDSICVSDDPVELLEMLGAVRPVETGPALDPSDR